MIAFGFVDSVNHRTGWAPLCILFFAGFASFHSAIVRWSRQLADLLNVRCGSTSGWLIALFVRCVHTYVLCCRTDPTRRAGNRMQ